MGLSVALGGCGARLSELVAAYAALANGGEYQTLKFIKSKNEKTHKVQICSAEAAFLVTEILAGIERPDIPSEFLSKSKLPRIAWKTGTSFGRRDAWAIGYNPRYTIGVWMGNMDGSTVLGMSGGKTAVPLMLELFNAIDYDADKTWFRKPKGIRARQVCKFSGKLPAPFCTQLMDELAIAGISPTDRCAHATEILCDASQEVQFCPSCVPESGFQKLLFPNYAPNLALWMERNGIQYEKPPQHNPHCTAVFQTPGPRIFSPAAEAKYLVEAGKEILLQAVPTVDAQRHYWYVNGDFLGSCPAGEKFFFAPKDGKQQIECMDDKGRKGFVKIEIEIF
jgi:penicillin-binding protein 1C